MAPPTSESVQETVGRRRIFVLGAPVACIGEEPLPKREGDVWGICGGKGYTLGQEEAEEEVDGGGVSRAICGRCSTSNPNDGAKQYNRSSADGAAGSRTERWSSPLGRHGMEMSRAAVRYPEVATATPTQPDVKERGAGGGGGCGGPANKEVETWV